MGQVGVGVIGAVFLGTIQDKQLDQSLAIYDQNNQTSYHETFITEHKTSIFGEYLALDGDKLLDADSQTVDVISQVQNEAKKDALRTVSILPTIMLVCYVLFILYFKFFKGGYKPIELIEENEVVSEE